MTKQNTATAPLAGTHRSSFLHSVALASSSGSALSLALLSPLASGSHIFLVAIAALCGAAVKTGARSCIVRRSSLAILLHLVDGFVLHLTLHIRFGEDVHSMLCRLTTRKKSPNSFLQQNGSVCVRLSWLSLSGDQVSFDQVGSLSCLCLLSRLLKSYGFSVASSYSEVGTSSIMNNSFMSIFWLSW